MQKIYFLVVNFLPNLNMRVSTRIRYGLRTMIEIANATDEGGILQKDIAKNQNISLKYLDCIISSLKLKGLIANAKGRGSGYKLTRMPNKISMYDIYTAFEKIEVVECVNNKWFCERSQQDCKALCYWSEFKTELEQLLMTKNLDEIMKAPHIEFVK
ncbi:MAG: Rrf2 family transcriptional regulator [Paludibacter sp.]|nr:Rrf2 family transcriptional regulator [Paludibacter sp.]